jgi:putative endonuclease
VGLQGETAAAEELERLGYRIVARNFRAGRIEVDLVAEQGGDLVFVEVKTRSSLGHGLPAEAVSPAKQRRLAAAAAAYCADQEDDTLPVRFDVVEVVLLRGRIGTVSVIRAAFEAPEELAAAELGLT